MTDPGAAVRKRQPFFSVNECEIWKGDPVYKLIVSDIDATLINSKFLIPDYNLEMIRRVREALYRQTFRFRPPLCEISRSGYAADHLQWSGYHGMAGAERFIRHADGSGYLCGGISNTG